MLLFYLLYSFKQIVLGSNNMKWILFLNLFLFLQTQVSFGAEKEKSCITGSVTLENRQNTPGVSLTFSQGSMKNVFYSEGILQRESIWFKKLKSTEKAQRHPFEVQIIKNLSLIHI